MKLTRRQIALGVSISAHVVLAIVLLFWYVPRAKQSGATARTDAETLGETLDRAAPQPPKAISEIAAESADVSDEQVERSLESQIDSASKLPDEQKLSELEKNLQRLESIADTESVQQVSEKIAGSLGLDVDQYADKAAPSDGQFNIDTSQLSDVKRIKNEKGGWSYESVMRDADGREMTVPLTEAEGESLYQTFQLMKQYPMAEGIYRSVVMPMMQKILEAQQMELQLPEPPEIEPVVEIPDGGLVERLEDE
ncbi:MAG: hypothetical protein AAFX06_10390 [Planctomycetota bacterium]